ncbi:hypothetical protein [Cellulomonas fimi]|uniref:Uncharacterized protein n=1 Tax=Cellulomonas fimi (strain ATCC 484 / DSM 20113 / JCM 1341 / CCUG 24087 / LMG 16345 / NBRC 15513 / NCIMB 8980 / NCTC 7547 / NRS-133) TaxID=590998 RepID=F4H1Z9_CELFA|nr:hypothetical protein [Cellulomonas fimi]AEE45169.1 hypothetical protein Celf_1032 [Cellulomonas fimi ATCC 484]NNH06268.1 hypothetical protein [Cellulomonas fimi]VEH28452.1 Uncharacterised protein [Cellulomonas fimi]
MPSFFRRRRADQPSPAPDAAPAPRPPDLPRVAAGIVPAGILPADAGPALGPHLQACAMLLFDGEPRPVHDLGERGGWAVHAPEALAGTLRLPLPEWHVVGFRGGGDMHVLTTQDQLAPSRVLVVDQLFAAVGRRSDEGAGMLVAVPHASAVAVHVVSGGTVLSAARGMLDWATSPRPSTLLPVTPHLHHRAPDGALRPVTVRAADGTVRLDTALLAELVGG